MKGRLMRKLRMAVLAGVAALCVAGTAVAASNDTHIMTVDLPDGSVARIEYQGDVAPKVRIDPTIGFVPIQLAVPFDAAPFATFDRVFAELGRQAGAMMRQARALELEQQPHDPSARPDLAAFGAMPAGTVSYRFVSTGDGTHVCSRSWQWTSQGSGKESKLISSSSGDCRVGGPKAAPAVGGARAKGPETAPADTI
jgi:hypothetical protein